MRAGLVTFAMCVSGLAGPATAAPIGCERERPAVVAYGGQDGALPTPTFRVVASTCEFEVSCPQASVGGCLWEVSVAATGTGLIEVEAASDVGTLRCTLAMNECRSAGTFVVPPGEFVVFACSVSGVASGVAYSCFID